MNDRQYKPNIADLMDDLDSKVYGMQKVSRKDREQESSSENEDDDESGEYDMSESESQNEKDNQASDSESVQEQRQENKIIAKLTENKNDGQVDEILSKLRSEE